MSLPNVRATGNLVSNPEIKFLPQGTAVTNFRIACNSRRKNPQTNEWEDGDTTFLTINAWKGLAENIANQFTKGQKITIDGRLKQREYQTKEGEKRTVFEVEADEVSAPVSKFNDDKQPSNGGWNNTPQGGFSNEEAPF